MAWTVPRTWTTGELVTAAIMNTHVRDNLNVLTFPNELVTHTGTGAAQTLTANTAYFCRIWVPASITVTKFRYYLSATSGNGDVGIYDDSSGPANRLWSRGTHALGATGQQDVTIASGSPTTLTLLAGNYWLAFAADNAVAQLPFAVTLPVGLSYTKTTSFVLPATITTPTASAISPCFAIS